MALVNMKEMLMNAKKGGYAVPGFTVINHEMAKTCINAAQEVNSPAIISYAYDFEDVISARESSKMLINFAEQANVPVAVHLDHARNIDWIKECLDLGFSSAMIDASAKPFEENVRITREVVELADKYDASVEAELGHVGGLEWQYGAGNTEIAYTDVEEAKAFIEQTGAHMLAVAIGTVHGVYKSTPKLNLERLKELSEALPCPLVMHGGSGLSDDDFKNAASLGICKINIHTDLCQAAMRAVHALPADTYYLNVIGAMMDAMKVSALHKYRTFMCENRA